VLQWVQDTVGKPLPDLSDAWLCLKNGLTLCELANTIKPGSIKRYNTKRMVAI
jgi:hypothetical protein